jgi:hypothetical protein
MEERPIWARPGYYERQAAHFRELASAATTARLKTRLLREAEEHEQIARGEPVLAFPDE